MRSPNVSPSERETFTKSAPGNTKSLTFRIRAHTKALPKHNYNNQNVFLDPIRVFCVHESFRRRAEAIHEEICLQGASQGDQLGIFIQERLPLRRGLVLRVLVRRRRRRGDEESEKVLRVEENARFRQEVPDGEKIHDREAVQAEREDRRPGEKRRHLAGFEKRQSSTGQETGDRQKKISTPTTARASATERTSFSRLMVFSASVVKG